MARAGRAGRVGSLVTEAANLTTAEGLETLNAELAELEGEGRREIAERIKTAREWGDLKENSEYHDAKNEQAHLETKIARLREKIAAAVIVEEAAAAGGVGRLRLHGRGPQRGRREKTWQIVSSHDAAPARGAGVGRIADGDGAAGPRQRGSGRGVAPPRLAFADDPVRQLSARRARRSALRRARM